jgi:putative thioredoxin
MSHIINLTSEEFSNTVIKNSYQKLVVVLFYTKWCEASQKSIESLTKIKKYIDSSLDIFFIDVEESVSISQMYTINSVPEVKIFDDGKVVEEFLGHRNQTELYQAIAKYVCSAKDVRLEYIESFYKSEPQKAIDMIDGLYSLYAEDSHFKLVYAKVLIENSRYSDAIVQLKDINRDDKYYANAISILSLIDNNYKENKMQEELNDIYSKAVEEVANQDYRSAVSTLVEMYKKDPCFKDEAAKKLILNIVNEHLDKTAVNYTDTLR